MRARVFVKQPDLLMQMLLLRLQGWSEYALARKYDADKTTIEHWCDKFGVAPIMGSLPMERQVTVITFIPVTTGKQYKYQHLFDEEENLNTGKTYDEIRVASRKRQLIRQGTL